jgi:hypothetical protein
MVPSGCEAGQAGPLAISSSARCGRRTPGILLRIGAFVFATDTNEAIGAFVRR